MKLEEIQKQATEIAIKYGYPVPKISINNRMIKTHADSNYFTHEIRVSKLYADFVSDDDMINLLKHEIVHFKHPYHNGPFGLACMALGVPEKYRHAKHRTEGFQALIAKTAKVQYICPNGHIIGRTRPHKKEGSCPQCSKTFDPRFILKRVK